MKRVDVVYAFITDPKKEKILTVKNIREEGFDYTLPGGAVEEGENLIEAVIREVKEETGLDIVPGNILTINEALFSSRGHHTIFFTFEGIVTGGTIELTRPEEILEINWMDLEEAEKKLKSFGGGIKTYNKDGQSVPYYFRGTI